MNKKIKKKKKKKKGFYAVKNKPENLELLPSQEVKQFSSSRKDH